MDFKSTLNKIISTLSAFLSKASAFITKYASLGASRVASFFSAFRAPKVSCPKCKEVHEINAECRCPACGAKYKLPEEYSKYVARAQKKAAANANAKAEKKVAIEGQNTAKKAEVISDGAKEAHNGESSRETALRIANENRKRLKMGRMLLFGACAVAFSIIFTIITVLIFKDKDALLFKTGEYVNQPIFYTESDGLVRCAFPNDKGCSVGNGEVISYISSADGKCVYLTYSGAFGTDEISNYVLRISKFGQKIEKIYENETYIPEICSGGNNMYLYIMVPKDEVDRLYDLYISVDGEIPRRLSDNALELAVSTSGRYALVSLDDSGASKLMLYGAEKDKMTNPGIKNAHPLSVDNKGEYMIYAKKGTSTSTEIVSEKSTTKRVEIPLLKDTELTDIVFSADRRSFAIQYTDRTVFYSCGDDDYTVANTDACSQFGYNLNKNVRHNILSFKEIPTVSDSAFVDLLPYFFFDSHNKCVYRITKSGAKEAVFDSHVIDDIRVSENNRVAFVSKNTLYSGKLDRRSNDICEIMNFTNKTLVDISPDGNTILYTDSDGNMFSAEYGKRNSKPEKISVDPDRVRIAKKGNSIVVISGTTASIVGKNGKSVLLCEGIIPEETFVADKKLSKIFYTVSEGTDEEGNEKKRLHLYSGGKSATISEKLAFVTSNAYDSRIDITRSDYICVATEAETADAGTMARTAEGAVSEEAEAIPAA